jgi:hypothetical protein
MDQRNASLTTWNTEKRSLDGNIFVAELSPEAKLWLLNDTNKKQLELSARATYDLMLFLHERAVQTYEATHHPQESYAPDEISGHYHILPPTGTEGEYEPPPADILYADVAELYLTQIFTVAEDWAQDAYDYNTRVVRIEPVETSADTPEPLPDFLQKHTTWYYFTGEADQSWKVTIWPQSGWQSSIVDHLYVHRLGDVLVTGGSESRYGSAVPRYLLLPLDDEDEYDEDLLDDQQDGEEEGNL